MNSIEGFFLSALGHCPFVPLAFFSNALRVTEWEIELSSSDMNGVVDRCDWVAFESGFAMVFDLEKRIDSC